MTSPTLGSNPFFSGLKPAHLDLITRYLRTDFFKPEEYIFKEGDDAENFYIISKGKVNVEIQTQSKSAFSIQTLEDGDILGWSWLIEPNQWRFSARAVEKSELIVIEGKPLKKACEMDHELGYEIFKRFAGVFVQRLDAARRQLMEVYRQL